jgi:WD40 repeat protein
MKLLPAITVIFSMGLLNAQDTIPHIILEGHLYTVFCIDFSEDNKYLVSGAWDNTVKVWDFKKSKEIKSFNYHTDMIRDVCFSPGNSMIASASRDNSIKVVNLFTGEVRNITNQYKPNIEDYYRNTYFSSISFTPDNQKLLFTLAGRNEIFIWDLETNSLSDKIYGPESGVRKLELSNDGQFIAGITGDNAIIVWDYFTKKEVAVLKGQVGAVGTLCFSNDAKYLVSGGGKNVTGRNPPEHYNLRIWDLSTSELISELSGHVDCVLKVQFTPDDRYISSASEDNSVRVWDVSTAEQIWKYESDCYFLSCGISPDGKYLAASSRDETIKIWELNKIIPNR